MDPCIKKMTNMLCLPDALKGFLACILKYTVSTGPGGQRAGGEKPREEKDSEWGPESSGGSEKGNGKG